MVEAFDFYNDHTQVPAVVFTRAHSLMTGYVTDLVLYWLKSMASVIGI